MNLVEIQDYMKMQLEAGLASLSCTDSVLAEAMNYALTNGGKRLRPYLVYITCEALGGSREQANTAAIAIEMLHSYSLVHDDLPAMDDDDLRRGKPTCHIVYGEATAILVGDALLTAAFELLANACELTEHQRLKLIQLLSKAAGASGMVAGQSIDLSHVGQYMNLEQLSNMHRHKTGALIQAAVLMGAVCAQTEIEPRLENALIQYAEAIGLAFQVQDDILDIKGDPELLGKPQGADIALNKPTYPALLGLDGAQQEADRLIAKAHLALQEVDANTEKLASLADFIVNRQY